MTCQIYLADAEFLLRERPGEIVLRELKVWLQGDGLLRSGDGFVPVVERFVAGGDVCDCVLAGGASGGALGSPCWAMASEHSRQLRVATSAKSRMPAIGTRPTYAGRTFDSPFCLTDCKILRKDIPDDSTGEAGWQIHRQIVRRNDPMGL